MTRRFVTFESAEKQSAVYSCLISRSFCASACSQWFYAHQTFVSIGLTVAFAGWIIGLVKINDGAHPTHRGLGITCMCLGLAQPFIAAVRPHPPKQGEKPTTARRVWALIHHWVGRAAYVIAIVNIFIGLSYFNTEEGKINNNTIAFLVCWLCVMVLGLGLEVRALLYPGTAPFASLLGAPTYSAPPSKQMELAPSTPIV